MKPEQEYKELYERMAALCAEQKWGDPFSYARSKEIYAAIALGHKVAPTLSGADAINAAGQEVEYKSTISNKVKGSYTGISVQPTWQEQEAYLKDDKIGKYPEHYFNRFSGGKLAESWMLTGAKVLELLTPKLKDKYATVLDKKDPRLGANITNAEIKKYGKQVI